LALPSLSDPSFVGRKKELSELNAHLKNAVTGKGSTILISGEAGCGKTRLCKEFLDTAKKEVIILNGWCLNGAAVPYFPFIEAFNALDLNEENETFNQTNMVTKLTKQRAVGGSAMESPLDAQMWKDQAFRAITQELLFLSTKKPTILFLDDIHWADSASLALLQYIAREINSERILVLATFRSEEILLNIEGYKQPLFETLHLMGREGLYSEIKLSTFNQKETEEIATSMLGNVITQDFAKTLSEESQGNALFITESLRLLIGQGSIIHEKGKWRLIENKIILPEKVKDIILIRLGSLKIEERRILDTASVIGPKFEPTLLANTLSKNKLNILETLSSLAQNRLLVLDDGDYYRFKHARIQEMLYSEIPPTLKKAYHHKIAESLEQQNIDSESQNLSNIAYHYVKSGNIKKAIQYSLAAGKDAFSKFSYSEANNHFTYVLGISSKINQNEIEIALEGLGDSLAALSFFEEAIKTYDKLASLTENSSTKLRALRKEMDAVWFKDVNPSRLPELVKRAEPLASTNRLENARVVWNKSRILVWQGPQQLKEAIRLCEEALDVFIEEGSLLEVASITWPIGMMRIMINWQVDKGVGEILQGLAMLRDLKDIRGEIQGYRVGTIDYLFLAGLFEEGYQLLSKLLQLAEKTHDWDSLGYAWLKLSDKPILTGDFQEAILRCQKAIEFIKKTDKPGLLLNAYSKLLILQVLNGNLKDAEETYSNAKKFPQEVQNFPTNFYPFLYAESFLFAAHKEKALAEKTIAMADSLAFKLYSGPGIFALSKSNHAGLRCVLGDFSQAASLMKESQEIIRDAENKFSEPNVQVHLIMKKDLSLDIETELRLDFVNVSRGSVLLQKVENIIPAGFVLTKNLANYRAENNYLTLDEKIDPFGVKTIKLWVKPTELGLDFFEPRLIYLGNQGQKKAATFRQLKINVKAPRKEISDIAKAETISIKFKSVSAQKAFDYLVKSYLEDYSQKKLPKEKAGWRTQMDLVKDGRLTQYSVYGPSSNHGKVILELKNTGLIELRVFEGERGRTGKITKLRIKDKNETVYRYLEHN
jgi:tetratricopeptide (TPR) repeat protein